MSFISKLLKTIGGFFVGLLNAAKKVWLKLSPDLQNAMLQASGVVSILNANAGSTGFALMALIKHAFPGLDDVKLKQALSDTAGYLKLGEEINNTDLVAMLEGIAKHLDATNGTKWAQTSHDLYTILAKVFAPEGTKLTVIIQLAEFVYHNFIKKD